MESNEDDVSWWRADARALARWTARTVGSITRADLIFIGYGLALCAAAFFVWPAPSVMTLIWLPQAVRLFIWPDRAVLAVKRRMAEGDDRYFEEQRALRAYGGGTARQIRRQAAFGIVLCLAGVVLSVYDYHRHHAP
ncbi:MAG: hypothetical protein J0H11_08785 [Rhizobiales bacterium]|nr:hypothetical protein [Hyphomicrobiales bacterium]